jgi:hypothetical protein
MTDPTWEHAVEARAALRAIVTDPDHGVAALTSAQTMSNLLKDLLPDAPREKSLLVAAAEAGLASKLREHVEQGLDPSSAIRLAASSLSNSVPFTPEACTWVTNEIAAAIGIGKPADSPPAAAPQGYDAIGGAPTRPTAQPGSSYPTSGAPGAQQFGQGPAGGYPQQPGQGYGQAASYGPAGNAPGFGSAGQAVGAPAAFGSVFPPPPGQGYPQAAGGGYQQGAAQFFQPGPPGYQGVKKNSLAITALVCGIAQFVLWFAFLVPGLIAAIMAIVFGGVALRQIRRTGEAGRGMAIAGIVCAAVGIAIVTLLLVIGLAVYSGEN